MQDISFYLKKFENLGLREKNIKESVIKIVKEKSNVELEEGDIQIISDQIKINKTGPEKTEIFIHKKEIEEFLNNELNTSKREVKMNKKVI